MSPSKFLLKNIYHTRIRSFYFRRYSLGYLTPSKMLTSFLCDCYIQLFYFSKFCGRCQSWSTEGAGKIYSTRFSWDKALDLRNESCYYL